MYNNYTVEKAAYDNLREAYNKAIIPTTYNNFFDTWLSCRWCVPIPTRPCPPTILGGYTGLRI